MSKREVIKELLVLAETSEQADKILETHMGLSDISQKLAYLRGMFDIELMPRSTGRGTSENDILRDDYLAFLATIIDLKWR